MIYFERVILRCLKWPSEGWRVWQKAWSRSTCLSSETPAAVLTVGIVHVRPRGEGKLLWVAGG